MKTITILCAALLLLSSQPIEANRLTVQCIASDTCTIDDQSTENLGIAAVYYAGGSTNIPMPTSGTYTPTVSGAATSIVINSQSVSAPMSGIVALPNGDSVQVQWTATNAITIVDVTQL